VSFIKAQNYYRDYVRYLKEEDSKVGMPGGRKMAMVTIVGPQGDGEN
jgi:hypothetical protein